MIGRGWLMPWVWILLALLFLGIFLVYPVIETIRISLLNANSTSFVGMDNYTHVFTQGEARRALLNSLLWLVLFTSVTVGLGLVIAVLTDHVRYEVAVKALIFVPMAISFVAAGVIWTLMYQFRPDEPGFTQTGTVNAVLTWLSISPVAWLVDQGKVPFFGVNNLAIILAGVWMWTGFAMVVLAAGLKGISSEVLEAARVDGAGEWQIFRRIIIPLLWPTIVVVAITLMINALKIFDLVFVMTGGRFGTDVIATRMWREMFISSNFGRASALAVLLLLAIVPVLVMNIRRFRSEADQ
ncbi:MAG: carbohydrate ABC transporter permease [Dehalococcoidia bacterium]